MFMASIPSLEERLALARFLRDAFLYLARWIERNYLSQ